MLTADRQSDRRTPEFKDLPGHSFQNVGEGALFLPRAPGSHRPVTLLLATTNKNHDPGIRVRANAEDL